MGAKFGHFSVLDGTVDEVTGVLRMLPRNTFMSRFDRLRGTLDPNAKPLEPDGRKFLELLGKAADVGQSTFFIGTNGKWVTVFQDDGGSSAEWNALRASESIHKRVLHISLFDDDMFTLALYEKGVLLTKHVSGSTEPYGVKASLGDLDIISSTFSIPAEKGRLEKILSSEDLGKKIDDLETLLAMKLWVLHEQDARKLGWKKVIAGQSAKSRKEAKDAETAMQEMINRRKNQQS